MRPPGIGEILLIIIVVAIVIMGVKIFGTPPAKKGRRVVEYEDEDEDEAEAGDKIILKSRRSRRAQILGITVILVGAIVMISTFSMVKWFFWGPIGAIALMVVGIITIFIARRR
ncbi:MAG: hypothetical protein MUO92_00735 [Dehalococcoidales bacterium]|nr:hypothetical protein [Dehalococcoidales bacterium]